MRSWIIGSGAGCDLVVAQPTVSGRHCRLTEASNGFLVEDLGSSNGTYVNRLRISMATRVSAGDSITLGLTIPMPWPLVAGTPGVSVIRIGRDEYNNIVLDDPRVSGRHARLIVAGSQTLIEDAGSANGTFVNSPDRRATQAIPLTETDIVYFGSLSVPAARLLPPRSRPVPVPATRAAAPSARADSSSATRAGRCLLPPYPHRAAPECPRSHPPPASATIGRARSGRPMGHLPARPGTRPGDPHHADLRLASRRDDHRGDLVLGRPGHRLHDLRDGDIVGLAGRLPRRLDFVGRPIVQSS